MSHSEELDLRAVTALRVLAVDQVEKARSGHPGLPLGVAPMAWALFSRHLRFDPTDPEWPDRDRFVLSAGHGSALLYALLHLFGYPLPMSELERFRQWGSKTPGHPEFGHTAGVETTTGPLGQGIATAVGMALAERHLAARFNSDGFPVVGHRTFVIASDGDMMEGVSHEAASFAGHLGLGRLIVLYDDNRITIEGSTDITFSEDVAKRFEAYGWRTLAVEDGNDLEALDAALVNAQENDDRPVLIRVRTCIGFGAPTKAGTAECHGSPLGAEEAAAMRRGFGWELPPFQLPDDVVSHARSLAAHGRQRRAAWREMLVRFAAAHPERAAELDRRLRGDLPSDFAGALPDFTGAPAMATREASGKVLNALASRMPELLGGSADLAPSNNTLIKGEPDLTAAEPGGRNIRFGVREHAMGAIANGLSLHGGIRPYTGTFLIFSDYMRPAIRLAALMEQPVVYVFTHDSIALGEDGPTHQPIEQLATLRAIPNLEVMRPADAFEAAACWKAALERRNGPTALALTRQKLPPIAPPPPGAMDRGAWTVDEASSGRAEVVLLASGSEVALARAVRALLEKDSVATRVVSVPCLDRLQRQDAAYVRALLPEGSLRVAIEMAHPQSWAGWVGADGIVIGLDRFGASAPGDEAARRLGFDAEAIAARVRTELASRRPAPLSTYVPPTLAGTLAGRYARLESLAVLARIQARDAGLWGDRATRDVGRRLGWLDAPSRTAFELAALERLVAGLVAEGVDTLYLLGMGGSSLAPRVLRDAGGAPSGRELVVVDTTDPDAVGSLLDRFEPRRSAVLAVSKSGTTVETAALTEIFWHRAEEDLGERTGSRFVALTEPGSELAHQAQGRRWRAVIGHPVDVGGRFSALTAVGILPALWLGLDANGMLVAGARALADLSRSHPAVELAALLGSVAQQGSARLAFCPTPALAPLGAWVEQLVAESTGKEGKGILPVPLDTVPGPAAAWPGTVYLSPRLVGEDTLALDAALDALAAAGHPVVRWTLGPQAIAEAFAVLELATAITALFLGVNPFDEPDVVRAKDRARAALSERHRKAPEPAASAPATLDAHLSGLGPDDAIALLAYLPERAEISSALQSFATRLSARHRVPVTVGFGPRYLHSTGQLHKGGPEHLVPIVLTSKPERQVTVPGRSFTLGELRLAQALGDLAALRELGRRALHLDLGEDALGALSSLASTR